MRYSTMNTSYLCYILVLNIFFMTNGFAQNIGAFTKENTPNLVTTPAPEIHHFTENKSSKITELTRLKQEMDSTLENLKNMIGDATCEHSNQCNAAAIGKKACGGPISYLPFSNKNDNTTQIIELSLKHQQLNHKLNDLRKAISNCSFVVAPTVECQINTCQIVIQTTMP